MFTFTPIVFAVVVSTAINIFVTVVSWRRKKARYGLYFALGMTGITFWTLMSALDYAATPLNLKILFATLEGWGYMSAHPFFAMFAMSFGNSFKKPIMLLSLCMVQRMGGFMHQATCLA